VGYFAPREMMARLAEEAGEVARELNHLHGPKKKKDDENTAGLSSELGDILFTIAAMANTHDIDLEVVWKGVMDKCYGRDANRWEKKNDKKLSEF